MLSVGLRSPCHPHARRSRTLLFWQQQVRHTLPPAFFCNTLRRYKRLPPSGSVVPTIIKGAAAAAAVAAAACNAPSAAL